MRKHPFPIEALLVAFGEWAGSTADSTLIRMQKRKLDALRRALHDTPPDSTLQATAHAYVTRFRQPEHAAPTLEAPSRSEHILSAEQPHLWVMLSLPPNAH